MKNKGKKKMNKVEKGKNKYINLSKISLVDCFVQSLTKQSEYLLNKFHYMSDKNYRSAVVSITVGFNPSTNGIVNSGSFLL